MAENAQRSGKHAQHRFVYRGDICTQALLLLMTTKTLTKLHKLLFDREKERQTWATLVGRFMLAFGDIENVTLLALERISSESVIRTARSLPLAKRIELLIELLESKEGISDEARADFIKGLGSVKKMSETRNIIAHNPLILSIYMGPPDGLIPEPIAGEEIISLRNEEKRITFRAIHKLVEQAEESRTRLFEQYGRISLQLAEIQIVQQRKERRRERERQKRHSRTSSTAKPKS